MKRGVVPVLFLVFLGLGGAAAHAATTPQPPATATLAIMRTMHAVPMHAPALRPAPLLDPIIVPRSGSLGRPMIAPQAPVRQPNPSQISAPEAGANAPPGVPPVQSAPLATPTPNPLHFRRMALPQIIALAS